EINSIGMMASTIMFALGLGAAHGLYYGKGFELDKQWAKSLGAVYLFSLNKWYWDELYMGVTKAILKVYQLVWLFVDKLLIDTAFINTLVRDGVLLSGGALRVTESGRGQAYALTIFAGVALIGLTVYFVLIPSG